MAAKPGSRRTIQLPTEIHSVLARTAAAEGLSMAETVRLALWCLELSREGEHILHMARDGMVVHG